MCQDLTHPTRELEIKQTINKLSQKKSKTKHFLGGRPKYHINVIVHLDKQDFCSGGTHVTADDISQLWEGAVDSP